MTYIKHTKETQGHNNQQAASWESSSELTTMARHNAKQQFGVLVLNVKWLCAIKLEGSGKLGDHPSNNNLKAGTVFWEKSFWSFRILSGQPKMHLGKNRVKQLSVF